MPKDSSRTLPHSGEEIRFLLGKSSLGTVLVAEASKGIVSILIGEHREELIQDLRRRFPRSHIVPEHSDKENLLAKVITFIEKPDENLDLPLDLRGTAFQKRVWNALRDIPLGETTT
jgi:AraC family transcriptional regulator of adaptative response/methylated-DNA-[protein]-cysteine methyltransferase